MCIRDSIGKALTYTRNQWAALNRYVESGELAIDNNPAERAMRPVAIGRENWLFVGSPAAGQRSAILMSLIASCKNNGVEPRAYLRDVLGRLATEPDPTKLQRLLPDAWLKENSQHLEHRRCPKKRERQQDVVHRALTTLVVNAAVVCQRDSLSTIHSRGQSMAIA